MLKLQSSFWLSEMHMLLLLLSLVEVALVEVALVDVALVDVDSEPEWEWAMLLVRCPFSATMTYRVLWLLSTSLRKAWNPPEFFGEQQMILLSASLYIEVVKLNLPS